ncbi:peptidylprolyl isomerase [Candidatus Acetothermia bacterium]|nr:peptidylprolyl isomerase [Candidatus Acetothermia bacterium]MBI3643552.1 peptidylprolyl isomerase [Candidatus Acetothermia bacterium]
MQNQVLLIALVLAVVGLVVGILVFGPASSHKDVNPTDHSVVTLGDNSQQTSDLAGVAILANGAKISDEELDFATHAGIQVYKQLYQQLNQDYQEKLQGTTGEYQRLQHEAQAADGLIYKSIVRAEIKKRGITVPQDEVDKAFNDKYHEYLQYIFGIKEEDFISFLKDPVQRQQFQQALFEAGLLNLLTGTYEEFRDVLRANAEYDLQEQALKNTLITRVTPSDAELLDYIDKNRGKYMANIVEAVVPSDTDLQSYFDMHRNQYADAKKLNDAKDAVKQDFMVEAQGKLLDAWLELARSSGVFPNSDEVHARHILVAVEEGASPDKVQSAQVKIEHIQAALQQGADFAQLAKDNSDDQSNRDKGGDLGWFGHGMMVPEFDQAAFALNPGKTSGIIRTPFGFHVIQLLERRSTDSLKQAIAKAFASEKSDDQFKSWTDAQVVQATIKILDPLLAGHIAEEKGQSATNPLDQFKYFNEAVRDFEGGKSNPAYANFVGYLESRIYLQELKAFQSQLAALGPSASDSDKAAIQQRIDDAQKRASASFLQSQYKSWDESAFQEILTADGNDPELHYRYAQFLYDEKYDIMKALAELKTLQTQFPQYKTKEVADLSSTIQKSEGIGPDGLPGHPVEIMANNHIQPGSPHPNYNSIPPTSGPHYPTLAPYGVSDKPIQDEFQVHNLEHGAVLIQYRPGTDASIISDMNKFVTDLRKDPKYCKLMLAPYPGLDQLIAITAWGRILKLDEFDHTQAEGFVESFISKGPEQVNDCQP